MGPFHDKPVSKKSIYHTFLYRGWFADSRKGSQGGFNFTFADFFYHSNQRALTNKKKTKPNQDRCMVPLSEQSNLADGISEFMEARLGISPNLWSLMANVESMFYLFLSCRTADGEILCFLYNADKKEDYVW